MRLQLYCSDSLAARLRARAGESGVTVSGLAAVLIDQGLRDSSPEAVAEVEAIAREIRRPRARGRSQLDWLKDRQVASR